MSQVKLYRADQFSQCQNVTHPLYDYIRVLMSNDPSALIANITNAECYALEVGNKLMLLVDADYKPNQSYVTSIRAQYLDYAQEELKIVNIKGATIFSALFKGLKRIVPNKTDKVLYVGNYLFSTNLFESLSIAEIAEIEAVVAKQLPNRTIIFRSQNACLNKGLIANLTELGYQPFLSRQVYIADDAQKIKKKKSFKKDRQFARQTDLTVKTDFDVAYYADRIVDLYQQLYIEKYSTINPQYTRKFIIEMFAVENTTFTGIFDHDKLVGVTMSWTLDQVITVPILGYDLTYPQEAGIYRLLTYYTLMKVNETTCFHMSSGVGNFKLTRGAEYWPEFLYYKRMRNNLSTTMMDRLLQVVNKRIRKISDKHVF
ncbi:hypothetical protein SAMN04488134_103127 [Amphibacillus marinus]|uniref:Acetyltransferase (GNAT) domain-containing protein n=1 Tax=Amphibacillus marinus TaxID=872970 RepID=A0A1H8L8X4_9BACI|nr:hypothetical protein [Amphibacillus marinus]SEO01612.1 hypothetical protein SAMN04488134_103127 [Amphibacillus marinus]